MRNLIRKIILEELIKKLDRNFLVSEQNLPIAQSSGGGPFVSSGQAGGARSSVKQAIQISQIKGNAEDLLYQLEQFQKKSDDEKIKYITGGVNGNLFLDLFESELDATAVSELYNSGNGQEYPFTISNALIASPKDVVGTNHGTLSNGTLITTGKIGNAFTFDGVNDYVSLPNDSWNSTIGTDFSVSLWVNFTSTSNLGRI